MRIVLIAPNSFGYIHYLVDALNTHPDVKASFVNISEIKYTYKNPLDRIKNAFSKVFLNKNVKVNYKTSEVLRIVTEAERSDYILVIRPDLLEEWIFDALKAETDKLFCFYFDAISNFPKKQKLIPYFDKVFCYEKNDVNTFDLYFITNYIYDQDIASTEIIYDVFNVSSYDERYASLIKIAQYFKKQNISYKIIVRKEKIIDADDVEIVSNYLNLQEMKGLLSKSKVLLDIQKENQFGLSFRVFESLGYNKKLITTNTDIKTYDFYDSNNIFILDINNPISIPERFFISPYVPIAPSILYKYTINGWIEKVFGITRTKDL